MSRVQALEIKRAKLNEAELNELRSWFLELDAALWDEEIARDAAAGKLSLLFAAALKEHQEGRSTEL